MLALALGAVGHPDVAVGLRGDRTADQVLLRPGDGDRLAPLAGPVRLHEELIAEIEKLRDTLGSLGAS